MTITAPEESFEYAVDGKIIQSRIDLKVKDGRTGFIYPALVDFTNSKYEPSYNPIAYHAQTIVDLLNLMETNTNVLILSPSAGTKWFYDKRKYGNLIQASLREALIEIEHDFVGVRFGWWCSGCYYRGICHKLTKEHI